MTAAESVMQPSKDRSNDHFGGTNPSRWYCCNR